MFLAMGYGVYFFFATMMLLSIVFVFFFVPETSNIPLESIDRLFDIRPVRKANKELLEQLRVEDEDFRGNAGDLDFKKQDVENAEMANEV
jgi:hypothetical protein